MAYFISAHSVHEFPIYPEFLDKPDQEAFDEVTLIGSPDSLDLRASEIEMISNGGSAIQLGLPVNGAEAPKRLSWPSDELEVPDFFMKNCFAVSHKLKGLIEGLEPGLHQFFPFEVFRPAFEEPMEEYFWLNVCTRLDSVDDEATTYNRKMDYNGRPYWSRLQGGNAVFSKAKIGTKHLWFDPNLPPPFGYHCTNEFAHAATDTGISGISLTKCEEI